MSLFNLRFKKFPGGMQSGLIEASSLEMAYKVGTRWCEMETERLATFTPVKLIGVDPAVIADEGILKLARPEPLAPEQPREVISKDEQLRRISERNMAERVLPADQPEEVAVAMQQPKPMSALDKLKNLVREGS